MHKVLVVALLAMVAFAGCSGKKDTGPAAVTCPDGSTLTPAQIKAFPDYAKPGFNATTHCPVKPHVEIVGIPTSLQVFKEGLFRVDLNAGTYQPQHSMLLSVRWYDRSIADQDLTNMNKYPNELVKKEHQNLPISYNLTFSFQKVGTYYIRAYMEQGGNDYWSKEQKISITPVVPTGKVVEVDIGADGTATPDAVSIVLGDAVQIKNSFPLDETCSAASGPGPGGDLKAAGGVPSATMSSPVVFVFPGVFQYQCNDPQNHGFKVNVAVN